MENSPVGLSDGPQSAIEGAVQACAAVTGERWKQQFLVLLALRSFIAHPLESRLPLYLAPDESVDIAALRALLLGLYKVDGILVQPWVQTSQAHLSADGCIVQDLSSAPANFFYWVRQFAYYRSLPGNMLARRGPQ